MDKPTLRADLHERLRTLSVERRMRASADIREHLAGHLFGTVLLYAPIRTEVDVAPLFVRLADEGRLVLPRVEGARLRLHRVVDPNALVIGRYGLHEPNGAWPEVPDASIDVVVVPGLAFGADGRRLGRGGGYYDRLLVGLSAVRIGVMFECQRMDDLPVEPHDQRVHMVVTERGATRCAVGPGTALG